MSAEFQSVYYFTQQPVSSFVQNNLSMLNKFSDRQSKNTWMDFTNTLHSRGLWVVRHNGRRRLLVIKTENFLDQWIYVFIGVTGSMLLSGDDIQSV